MFIIHYYYYYFFLQLHEFTRTRSEHISTTSRDDKKHNEESKRGKSIDSGTVIKIDEHLLESSSSGGESPLQRRKAVRSRNGRLSPSVNRSTNSSFIRRSGTILAESKSN